MSSLIFLKLCAKALRSKGLGSVVFLVSNCVNKVNNFTNLFCEVNVSLPFWSLNSFSKLRT